MMMMMKKKADGEIWEYAVGECLYIFFTTLQKLEKFEHNGKTYMVRRIRWQKEIYFDRHG